MRRLVHDLNAETEKPLEKDRLNRVFDRSWTELETAIAEAAEKLPSLEPERSLENMVAEVVDTVRRMERTGQWLSRPRFTVVGSEPRSTVAPKWVSNETLAASKALPPGMFGPDLSGRVYFGSYGPVEDPPYPYEDLPQDIGEDSRKSED